MPTKATSFSPQTRRAALGLAGYALLLCGLGAPLSAQENDPAQALAALRRQINTLQTELQDTRSRHGQLQSELQRIEQNIADLSDATDDIQRQLAAKQETLTGLEKRRSAQEQQLALQRRVLAQQVRAAYQMGRQDYLKILLNQEDPATLGRVLTYYDYFNRARATHIAQIQHTLTRIAVLEHSIREETQALQTLQAEHQARKQQLENERQERQAVLENQHAALNSQSQRLQHMQEDKQRLETLLNTVRGALTTLPKPETETTDTSPFAALKGTLPPPVKGEIRNAFGEARGVGKLKWQGMVIAAAPGATVRAVSAGRVVFAGWFRNYGQLLILDHEDGYMSLYGYNQTLLKQTGDWAAAGEDIARVGDSGGQAVPGLYFEIRRQGTPLNPRAWLREEAPA